MATRAEIQEDVRFMLNDPSTAANFLYSNAEIQDAIGRAYRQVSNVIRRHAPGYFQKLGYLSSSTSVFAYNLPSDCIRLVRVKVDEQGVDLSATPGSSTAKVIDYVPPAVFTNNEQGDDTTRVYTTRGRQILIAPVFSLAASNSIELWYEYSPSVLGTDTATPDFPEQYHDILVPMASRWCKASKNLSTQFEDSEINAMMTQMLIDLKTMHLETEQFRTALHRSPSYYDPSEDGVSPTGFHGTP